MKRSTLDNIDLTPGQLQLVKELLRKHLPDTEVWAYGSRVKFSSRPDSDLDMVAFATPEQESDVMLLREAFEESDLPFTVDFFIWDEVPDNFHKTIEQEHFILQEVNGKAQGHGWEATTIGDFCPLKYGKSLPKKERGGGQVPVYGSNGTVGSHSEACVDEPGIVIGRKGSVGAVHFSHKPFWPIDTAFYVTGAPHRDLRFTYYLLKSIGLERMNADSAVPGLNRGDAHSLRVKIPPLAEQRAIAQILGTLDDKIELNRQMSQTLEAMAQALFKSWFIDFTPVHAKAAGQDPGLPAHISALFPNHFEQSGQGPIPAGWSVRNLGDMVSPKKGKPITKKECIAGDVPVVAGGLNPAYFHNQSNVAAPVVTVSASGNAGFTNLYHEDIWASDCSFISREQSDAPYMWYIFLKINQENLYHMQHGAVQQHLYPSDIARLRICVPDKPQLWDELNLIISSLFEHVGACSEESMLLKCIRDTALPQLLAGKADLSQTRKLENI